MSEATALKGIKRAARKRTQADEARSKATAELRRYCLKAQKAKVPITRIAEEAGLSRQGVYDLLAERRAS